MSETAGSRKRLLIVDDSKVIRVTARKILRDHFETVEAVDGENGWEVLNNNGPFSLIVSDLTMPNLDGFGLLKRIRDSQQPAIRDIPVIIITGANDSEATKLRATQVGATDFISKPFDSVQLLARTQAHSSNRAATQALQEKTFTLEEQSKTDPLTGLSNESAFMDRGYQQLSYAIRHNTNLAVFLLEIDKYEALESHYGKPVTEAAIMHVANILGLEVRQEDIVARTGAARFSLLLPGMNKAGIRNLAKRISQNVSVQPLKANGTRMNISVSIGVSTPEIRRDTRLGDLLTEARTHLKTARSLGDHRVIFDEGTDSGTYETPAPGKTNTHHDTVEVMLEMANEAAMTEISISSPPDDEPDDVQGDVTPPTAGRAKSIHSGITEPVEVNPVDMHVDPAVDIDPEFRPVEEPNPGTSATVTGKVHFDLEDAELQIDETIVITAPFDAHFIEDHNVKPNQHMRSASSTTAESTASKTETSSSTRSPDTAGTDTLKAWQPQEQDIDNPETLEKEQKRSGFFKRMLGSMRSPFRR